MTIGIIDGKEIVRVDEKEIRQIIAEKYGVRADGVCLYHDYEFISRGGDNVRNDFIYGLVDLAYKNSK